MKILSLILISALVATIALLQRHVHTLRADNAHLAAITANPSRVHPAQPASSNAPDIAAEITQLRHANRDLLKLRNEVRQLREQKSEHDTLRAENERLRGLHQTNSTKPTQPPTQPILIAKENLSFQGFNTPEATAHTLFWAWRETNLVAFANCFVPERQSEINWVDDRMSYTSKIEIAFRRNLTPDDIQLGIQVYENRWIINGRETEQAHKIALPLKRFGNEWKVDALPHNF